MSSISKSASKLKRASTDLFFEGNSSGRKRQHWFVIRELTSRELKRRYARSYLGVVWSILNPLLNMIVMSLIFSYMFRRSIENFPVYYLIGMTIWNLFKTATDSSMTALVDNKMLLIKAKLPRHTFVLSRIYTAVVNFIYSLIPLIGIVVFFRIKITWRIILLVPDFFLLVMFSVGIGFALSIFYVFFADIKYLYEILLTIWMYLSAVFYPAERLPELMQKVLSYNPIYLSIDIARYSILYGSLPYYTEWIKLTLYALGTFSCGIIIFAKCENGVMKKI